MLATVAAVVAVVWWDEQREAHATIRAMGEAQAVLAQSIATSNARSVERPGELLVLRGRAGSSVFLSADGRQFVSERLAKALRDNEQTLVVPHEEAITFGLPRRRAIASFAHVSSDESIVVLSTAQQERERQEHALMRTLGALAIVSLIVMGFGTQVLREQRRSLSTERDRELVRANRMATVAALAGGVAHEIATPLGVIASRAEQLASRVRDDERGAKAVSTILEQTEHIERVMRGFLGLSRGEAGEAAEVALADVAHDAAQLVAHRFEAAGVALSVSGPGIKVVGDRTLLTHAVVNLLLNACEASPPGARVTLEVTNAMTVTDEGSGIDAAAIARVHEPFFTTKSSGSGLGLAIAREVAAHHGASLQIEPARPGPGTRAVITFTAAARS